MKKALSILLTVVLLLCSFSCIMPTYASYLAKQELNLAQYTIEDIANMPKDEFYQLLADFERVYDPYGTYDTDPIMADIIAAEENSGDPQISPQWEGGDPEGEEEGDAGTHSMLTLQAIQVLVNDLGFLYENTGTGIGENIVASFAICLSSMMPDKDENENVFEGHFYHAVDGDSWTGSTTNTALTNCRNHYEFAVFYAKRNEDGMLCDAIGRAMHYIQDVSQPHHAANIIYVPILQPAHKEFEEYVNDNIDKYVARITSINSASFGSNLTYSTAAGRTIDFLVKDAANKAYQYRSYVNSVLNQSKWDYVAQNAVPNAIGYSALLMYKIIKDAGRTFYEV